MVRTRHDTLVEATDALEAGVRVLGHDVERETVGLLHRRFEPMHQVAARAELSGGGVHAGIDLRGDGSTEAWTGRFRRKVVAPHDGEDAYAALRRALGVSPPA